MLQRHWCLTRGVHTRTEAERKRQMGKQERKKNGGNNFAAVMEAAPSDGRAYSTDSLESLSLSLPLSCSLSADENLAGWGSGDGVESGVGGGVGLLERVIFFFFSSGVKGRRSCVQSS